ncbi:MAG: crotonobetainyl-CoA--carnitine CoA-transferase [Planctomycetes bacterium]|nr:crotonobetainyl-CoA--carnitine CoA-transferase [Planctomycetota bacterium]
MSECSLLVDFNTTSSEKEADNDLFELLQSCPIPKNELLSNLGLFIKRQDLSRILFFHDLYQKIINVPGIIIEFGVRWGQTLALFESFRGIYEPYNYTRKIVGFDTFLGFPSVHEKDGSAEFIKEGAYSVTDNYDEYLENILSYHEKKSPISHMKKYKLIKGDATETFRKYLEEHPETVIALAFFDFDIYEPTKVCLELIRDHLTKGSIVGFDQLNHPDFPGETQAMKEVFGLGRYRLIRSPINPMPSYMVIE